MELADLIASPRNPLTARVFVNRVWHWLFGTGIVATTDDFGHIGERPSHPELLDYLAHRFVQERWSVKQPHPDAGAERDLPAVRRDHAPCPRGRSAEPAPPSLPAAPARGRVDPRLRYWRYRAGSTRVCTANRSTRRAARRTPRSACSLARSTVTAAVRSTSR